MHPCKKIKVLKRQLRFRNAIIEGPRADECGFIHENAIDDLAPFSRLLCFFLRVSFVSDSRVLCSLKRKKAICTGGSGRSWLQRSFQAVQPSTKVFVGHV